MILLLSGVGGVNLCGIEDAVELCAGDCGMGWVEGGGGGGNCICAPCIDGVGIGVVPLACRPRPCKLCITCSETDFVI